MESATGVAQRQSQSDHEIVGESPRTREALRLIRKVAPGPWPVLILGETGTGKELVARALHDLAPEGPFVTIDCSSLVGPLMESELFGHTRGAFTGAVGPKPGLIEVANGGTAFFDEIGELPLELQAKLLRVLQEKEYRPVGSLAPRKSDFRVIAATNRDLTKEVERGNFRRDLYYRLNVVSIKLAPLRERTEDIPPLIEHFLGKYGRRHELTREAREVMLGYGWPGNVRELENSIQQMVAIHSGPLLDTADLPSPLRNFKTQRTAQEHPRFFPPVMPQSMSAAAAQASPGPAWQAGPDSTKPSGGILPLMEMEKMAILEALSYTRGDRGVAAQLLGIGRTTLYRKLKEYQLGA